MSCLAQFFVEAEFLFVLSWWWEEETEAAHIKRSVRAWRAHNCTGDPERKDTDQTSFLLVSQMQYHTLNLNFKPFVDFISLNPQCSYHT